MHYNTVSAVSYTHLDVYKRQVQCDSGGGGGNDFACML